MMIMMKKKMMMMQFYQKKMKLKVLALKERYINRSTVYINANNKATITQNAEIILTK